MPWVLFVVVVVLFFPFLLLAPSRSPTSDTASCPVLSALPPPLPPAAAAVPPMAAAVFSQVIQGGVGWPGTLKWPCEAAAAAAAARARGPGHRKKLSASRKQESSCSHYSQDLEKTLPGKSFRHPLQPPCAALRVGDLVKAEVARHKPASRPVTIT